MLKTSLRSRYIGFFQYSNDDTRWTLLCKAINLIFVFFFFSYTLALIELISLYQYHYDHAKIINYDISMLSDIAVNIFHMHIVF